jgi:peroxiredoxin
MNDDAPAGPTGGRIQLGPGRDAYPEQARKLIAIGLGVAIVTAVVVGSILLTSTKHSTVRTVTIPAADRTASAALLQQAEAVGFHPNTAPGVGKIEGSTAALTPPADKSLLPVGSQAPAFTLRTPTGRPMSLASLRGKAVLLELFATWCPHCAAEAPHLKSLFERLPRSRYAFLSVNADGEDAPSVLAYHIYFGLPFPALLDPSSDVGSFHHEGTGGPVSKAYRVKLFPTFYVIDPHGRVAWSASGEQPDALLLRELRAAASS